MVKWGIIGYGRAGHLHETALKKMGVDYRTADIDPAKAANYQSADALIADYTPDIVSVATPNGNHAEMMLYLAGRVGMVVCEKPLTLTVADAERVIEAWHGKPAYYVAQNRYLESWKRARKLIGRSKVETYYEATLVRGVDYYAGADWRGTLSIDGGPLYTQVSHHIDFLSYLGKDLTAREARFWRNPVYDSLVETESEGMIKHGSGEFFYQLIPWGHQEIDLVIKRAGKELCRLSGRFLERLAWPGGVVVDGVLQNQYSGGGGTAAHHDKLFADILGGRCKITLKDGLRVVSIIEDWYKTREVSCRTP